MRDALKFITWPAVAGLLAALLILDRWVLPGGGLADQEQAAASYHRAVRAAAPSVVNIYTAKLVTERPNPLLEELQRRRLVPQQTPRQRLARSLGSGVIMTAQGHILTSNHVIAGAELIQVLLNDGRTTGARVVGFDMATDLAVLQIDLPELNPIPRGDADRLRVGDVVLAIGNPLGVGQSVTQGIVSALGRFFSEPNVFEDFIQTDAIIHPGNSGGALVDTRGRLLGINSVTYSANNQSSNTGGIGIGLAIPVNLAIFVMEDLIKYGEVIRGWLGVSVEPAGSSITESPRMQALVVNGVAEDSPARRAGIQPGDIITHIDDEPVLDGRLTMMQIAMLKPGDRITVTVRRGQQTLNLEAVIGTLNASPGPANTAPRGA